MVLGYFLGGFASILALLYWWLNNNRDYWLKRGVHHKTPEFFYGNIRDRITFKRSFHDFYRDTYLENEGHKYVGIFEGRTPGLMVRDPDLIRNIMTKDFDHFVDRPMTRFSGSPYVLKMLISLEGLQWKKVRAALTPTFTTGKIKAMKAIVEDCGQKLISFLNDEIKASESNSVDVDVKDVMSKFSLDVIASAAFGVECNSFSKTKHEFIDKISKFNQISLIKRLFVLSIIMISPPQWLSKMIPMTFFNMETVVFLVRVIQDTTKYRKEHNIRRNDFLQLLIDAQSVPTKADGDPSDEKQEIIDEETAIAQSVVFFIAGFETSSSLLAMACYSLAIEPQAQEKLRKEIDEKFFENDGKLTYEDLFSLSYLDMVMSETLRLYPPVARLDRCCTKPYQLGSLQIDVGTRMNIPCYGIQTDPKFYPDPLKFIPERFSPEEVSKRHPYVYMPFGQGPRICIGMRFAQMSTKLCLALIIKNYIIEATESTPIPFEYDPKSFLLKAKSPVVLRFKPIES